MDLHVSGIPFKMKEAELKEVFEKFGSVSEVTIVINHITRQNKGYGFVTMPNDEEALKAIKALHGSELEGRLLQVAKSELKKEAQKRSSLSASNSKNNDFNKNSFSKGSFQKGGVGKGANKAGGFRGAGFNRRSS